MRLVQARERQYGIRCALRAVLVRVPVITRQSGPPAFTMSEIRDNVSASLDVLGATARADQQVAPQITGKLNQIWLRALPLWDVGMVTNAINKATESLESIRRQWEVEWLSR